MKLKLVVIVLSIFLVACGSSKKTNYKRTKTDAIVAFANTYSGTKYKYGGTTKKGIDCSGLLFISFQSEQINLPRTARDMSKKGTKISLSKVLLTPAPTSSNKTKFASTIIVLPNSNNFFDPQINFQQFLVLNALGLKIQ